MYICVCNAITERQVHDCVAAGATTLDELRFELGVASCCGCCAQMAQEYLPGGAREGQATVLERHFCATSRHHAANSATHTRAVAA